MLAIALCLFTILIGPIGPVRADDDNDIRIMTQNIYQEDQFYGTTIGNNTAGVSRRGNADPSKYPGDKARCARRGHRP